MDAADLDYAAPAIGWPTISRLIRPVRDRLAPPRPAAGVAASTVPPSSSATTCKTTATSNPPCNASDRAPGSTGLC